MSLFEWFFERKNPAPRGHAEFGVQPNPVGEMANWMKILYLLIGGAIWVGYFFLFRLVEGKGIEAIILFGLIYLVLALLVHPKPRHDNMGWVRGIIDNPFRWSDDVNRFLFFVEAILLPGKLMILFFRIIFFYFSPR
jgi:hypothetical protein